jgi:predicted nucleic acid-binding protein
MPESREMVINTGPVITLIAALGNLDALKRLYSRVIVPFEVCREIEIDNSTRFGAMEFSSTSWLEILGEFWKFWGQTLLFYTLFIRS